MLSSTLAVAEGSVGADVGFGAERFPAGLAGYGPQVGQPPGQAVPVDEVGYRMGDEDLEGFL